MSRYIETIRFEHGQADLLPLHEARLNRTRKIHYPSSQYISLNDLKPPDKNLWKCRLLYTDHIEDVEFLKYKIKKINSLKTVFDDTIEYTEKAADRSAIDRLFKAKENCDDIMIVRRGYITDASYANLIFFDGNSWYTPKTPLLAGVRREYLLATGQVKELNLRPNDLNNFSLVMLINAMLPFELQRAFPVGNIVP